MTPGDRFRWDRLSTEEAAVLRILLAHRGRESAIEVSEVARLVKTDSRQVQETVKSLVEVHHIAVGTAMSRPYGWYICASAEELEGNYRSFRSRALSVLQRARAFRPRGNPVLAEDFFGQSVLPLDVRHG